MPLKAAINGKEQKILLDAEEQSDKITNVMVTLNRTRSLKTKQWMDVDWWLVVGRWWLGLRKPKAVSTNNPATGRRQPTAERTLVSAKRSEQYIRNNVRDEPIRL